MIEINKLPCAKGFLGRISLKNTKRLNALNEEMITKLLDTLNAWSKDSEVKMVFIDSHCEKAFCAGGDIRALMGAESESKSYALKRLQRFFSLEYQLDFMIHSYRKPVIIWGNGYILGGGLGIFRGGDIRIATEDAVLSMPEIMIGLFPDVGAAWFLNQLPFYMGTFIGISGIRLTPQDGTRLGLATHIVENKFKEDALAAITKLDLDEGAILKTTRVLSEFRNKELEMQPSGILEAADRIYSLFQPYDPEATLDLIMNYTGSCSLLQTAAKNLARGSYLSARLTWEHFERCRPLSLQECFSKDLILAVNCAQYENFAEGVRALLVDKDNKPQWSLNSASEVTQTHLNKFFQISPATQTSSSNS